MKKLLDFIAAYETTAISWRYLVEYIYACVCILRFAAYLREFFFLIHLAKISHIYMSFLFSSVCEDLQRTVEPLSICYVFVYMIHPLRIYTAAFIFGFPSGSLG
jgi:hypothetical protein